MPPFTLSRKLAAEFTGTAFLLAVVVGSGIMGERLADGNTALALMGNTFATGVSLMVLITILGPVSGAHINPAVTLSFVITREIPLPLAGLYVVVQVAGAITGVMLAHVMFDLSPLAVSVNIRNGFGQWSGEVVATFGLVATILGCLRFRPEMLPWSVGLFIMAGYWFTSSTSFANPAVTVARALTDPFSGIRPAGATLATFAARWLFVGEASPARRGSVAKPLRYQFEDEFHHGP